MAMTDALSLRVMSKAGFFWNMQECAGTSWNALEIKVLGRMLGRTSGLSSQFAHLGTGAEASLARSLHSGEEVNFYLPT